MKLPTEYVTHLDHRITALMAFTLRRDSNWFGADHGEQKNLGDVYRSSLEGSGIMLRMLMEFLGVKAERNNPRKLVEAKDPFDVRLGKGKLKKIPKVDILSRATFRGCSKTFLARLHSGTSKRTAHPAFNRFTSGLDPNELRKATKWVLQEIWERCYKPDAIIIHRDIFNQLQDGKWENIPFKAAS
jgi:hypothetical protein